MKEKADRPPVAEKLGKIFWIKLAEKSLKAERRADTVSSQNRSADGRDAPGSGGELSFCAIGVRLHVRFPKRPRSLIGKTPLNWLQRVFIRTDDRSLKSWTRITLTHTRFKGSVSMKDGNTSGSRATTA